MTLLLLVALAGGFGALARFVVDGVTGAFLQRGAAARDRPALPLGTVLVNLSGSFLLGLLAGLALAQVLAPRWQLVIGTGLLGGYTTFSTASLETVALLQQRRRLAAGVYAFGVLAASVGLAALGLGLGAAWG